MYDIKLVHVGMRIDAEMQSLESRAPSTRAGYDDAERGESIRNSPKCAMRFVLSPAWLPECAISKQRTPRGSLLKN